MRKRGIKIRVFKLFVIVQSFLFRISGGRILNKVRGCEICVVKMKGAKSGKVRNIPLMYVPYEKGVVLVASLAGSDVHPSWYWNLKANPQIVVYLKGRKLELEAKQVDDEKKSELWPLICSCWSDYDLYQQKTERNIPVFNCQPT